MANDVIVRLSVQDAEALRAWQRSKEGIGGMQTELQKVKGGVSQLGAAAKAAQDQVSAGFAKLSEHGKAALKEQSAWGKGMAAMAKQRADAAAADGRTMLGQLRAAGAAVREAFTSAEEAVAKVGEKFTAVAGESAAGFLTVGGAIEGIVEGLSQAVELAKRLDEERDKAALTREEAAAKFINQARTSGVSRDELAEIAERVETEGAVYGHKGTESLDLAREAASQGVAVKEIPAFLEIANKFAAAQGTQLDLEMFKSFVAATRVEDEKLSVGAAATNAKAFFGTFLTRQLQPQQLEAFAKQNYGLKEAGLDASQRFAANTAALDLYGGNAEQAGTFNRAFFAKLRSAGGRKEAKKALEAMGLETGDVDFVGEDVHQVLDRLAVAIEETKEEERVPLLTHIFGEEYGGQAMAFIQKRQKLRDMVREIKEGEKEFEPAAAELTSTNAAKQRTAEAQTEIARSAHGEAEIDTIRKLMLAEMERQGKSAATQEGAKALFDHQAYLLRHADVKDRKEKLIELAASQSATGWFGTFTRNKEEAKRRFTEALSPRAAGTSPALPPGEESAAEDPEQIKAEIRARKQAAQQAADDKASAKVDKQQAAANKQKQRADDVARKKLDSQLAATRKQYEAAQQEAAEDAGDVDEQRRRIEAARKINQAGGRKKSDTAQLREQETIRRMQAQLQELEKKRAESEAKANELMARQNELLAQIAANTGGNAGAGARPPAGRNPPRIGGN